MQPVVSAIMSKITHLPEPPRPATALRNHPRHAIAHAPLAETRAGRPRLSGAAAGLSRRPRTAPGRLRAASLGNGRAVQLIRPFVRDGSRTPARWASIGQEGTACTTAGRACRRPDAACSVHAASSARSPSRACCRSPARAAAQTRVAIVGLTVVGALRVALAVLAEGGPLALLGPVKELPGQPHY
jgi:hypothetical protein